MLYFGVRPEETGDCHQDTFRLRSFLLVLQTADIQPAGGCTCDLSDIIIIMHEPDDNEFIPEARQCLCLRDI